MSVEHAFDSTVAAGEVKGRKATCGSGRTLLLQYDERRRDVSSGVVRERHEHDVLGHRLRDLTVQADGGSTPGVAADLDLAQVHVLGVDDLRVAEAGARPGLDHGLLGGPSGGQGLGLAARTGSGRAALTGGERLREPG